jgi:predicted small secreted protein
METILIILVVLLSSATVASTGTGAVVSTKKSD